MTGLYTITTAGDAEAQSGMAAHVLLVTKSMKREHFFNADGEMLIVAATGQAALSHRVRRHRDRAGRDLRHPARRDLSCRTDRRSGARLCLRELRRRVQAAGPRSDRRQLSRQCRAISTPVAAFEDSEKPCDARREMGRRLYAPRCRIRRSTSSPGTATTIPTNTTCGGSRRSARSVRSSRSVDLHGLDLPSETPAPPTSTS